MTTNAIALNVNTAAGVLLGAATGALGLMAGTYFIFSCAVMPGLSTGDDRTLILAMQQINVAIQNPLFFAAFFGSAALPAAAAVMLRGTEPQATRWAWIGFGLYLLGVITTVAVNVRLNNTLATVEPNAAPHDLAAARHDFLRPWIAWNIGRGLLTVTALGCLTRALYLHGRYEAPLR